MDNSQPSPEPYVYFDHAPLLRFREGQLKSGLNGFRKMVDESSTPSAQPQVHWTDFEHLALIETYILDTEDLILHMEDLNKSIDRLPEKYGDMFRHNVSWDEHRKAYILLHLLRSTICHVGKENLDLKKKMKAQERKLKGYQYRTGKRYNLRSRK